MFAENRKQAAREADFSSLKEANRQIQEYINSNDPAKKEIAKKIIDLAGLTYPPIAKTLREQPSLSLHSVEGGELLYKAIKKEHSEYLAVYPQMVPTLIARLGSGACLETITKPIIDPVESMPYLWIYKIEWDKVPETFSDYPPLPVIMLSIAVDGKKKAAAEGINEDSLRYRLRKDIELMGFKLSVIGKWLNRKARTAFTTICVGYCIGQSIGS